LVGRLKTRTYIFLTLLAFLSIRTLILAQPSLKGKPGISKQYAIKSARYADRSYKFAKMAYSVDEAPLAESSLDSARFFILGSITSMDSAIYFANDSDLMALDLANVSKRFSKKAEKKIQMAQQYKGSARDELARDACLLSANATADAYHASFYFRGKLEKKEEPKKEEPKEKVITRLDVDQTLFTMLDKQLEEKMAANKAELEKLEAELPKTKDAAKAGKIKAQIGKIQKEQKELQTKDAETKVKLADINRKVEDRDKSGKVAEEPPPARGLHYEGLEEWNKHLILDQELPPDLLYQVQVGVYKNKVLYEIFKGLTPVYGKTTPQGISYSIGMFGTFADASQAKEYVKSTGLNDAFVVAYYNRKKISTAEAQKLEKK
jgi:hypothetical protein